MNYGLYTSASGALTAMHRMDVWSNNLANVQEVAFKPDYAFEQQRPVERIEDHIPQLDPNLLMERLGGGVLASPTIVDFSEGPTEITGNPLDVAIRGDGFFMVDTGKGDEGIRYTRDGRFTLDDNGRLVTASQGFPVLDAQGREIVATPGVMPALAGNGDLLQDGQVVGQVGVVRFDDTTALKRGAEGLYRTDKGGERLRERVEPSLHTGAVEQSSVDPIRAMLAIRRASDNAQRNLRMISMFDELMGRTINTFARIG
jgi:flagellar basal body rod protein FlgG